MFIRYFQNDEANAGASSANAGAAPPPAPPVPDFKQFANAIADGLKNVQIKAELPAPPPAPPKHEWDDPAKFWLLPNDMSPEDQARELHKKQTTFTKGQVREMLKDPEVRKELLGELNDKFNKYDAAFEYFNASKADNKEFTDSKDAIKKIMDDEGCSYKTAKRIFDGEKKAPATAPAKPVPGKTATAPQSSVEPKADKSTGRKFGLARVKEIMREGVAEGKIKFGG